MHQSDRFVSPTALTGLAAAIAASLIICVGCDIEPAQDFTISVEPQAATLRQGQSAEFVASGGLTYSWAIDQASSTQRWGVLSAQTGERVRYTSVHSEDDTTHIQVLTVTSNLGDDDTSSNAVINQASAEVYIYHVP